MCKKLTNNYIMSFYEKLEETEQVHGLSETSMLELDKLTDRYLRERSIKCKTQTESDLSLKYFMHRMYKMWDNSFKTGKDISDISRMRLFPDFKQFDSTKLEYLDSLEDPLEKVFIDIIKTYVNSCTAT